MRVAQDGDRVADENPGLAFKYKSSSRMGWYEVRTAGGVLSGWVQQNVRLAYITIGRSTAPTPVITAANRVMGTSR